MNLIRPFLNLREMPWQWVFGLVLFSYFLVTAGVIYDIIVEPASIGQVVDNMGRARPKPFMEGRINSQYILEGIASSFLFVLGGLGFIMLETANSKSRTLFQRNSYTAVGFGAVLISYFALRAFISIKVP